MTLHIEELNQRLKEAHITEDDWFAQVTELRSHIDELIHSIDNQEQIKEEYQIEKQKLMESIDEFKA